MWTLKETSILPTQSLPIPGLKSLHTGCSLRKMLINGPVRNKVNFNLDDETKAEGVTTFSLDNSEEDDAVPAWIKAVQATADAMD